jgi:shikimate dehydrogenase
MVFTFRELKQSHLGEKPHYLVIGNPIRHSLSPIMHQFGLDHHGIEAEYHALELDMQDITGFMAWMNQETFLGCNITIPYKQEFIGLLDKKDSSVAETGAVNTIAKNGTELLGYNTDVEGFMAPLREYEEFLFGSRAIIFGTGGAARAVISGLIQIGVDEIVLVSRQPDKAMVTLPEAFTDLVFITACTYRQLYAYADEAAIFVNATPLGMAPNINSSPVENLEPKLLENKICYDLVYNPLQTEFLKTAGSHSAITITGLEMFIAQGDQAFQLWTGKSLPHDLIHELLTNILSGN